MTLSLSFNNNGSLGFFFRYIWDNRTYNAFYDDLSDEFDKPIDLPTVDVSMNGIELHGGVLSTDNFLARTAVPQLMPASVT